MFATINDNLAHEVDNGRIYGLFVSYDRWKLSQYISDYKYFNVYQTGLKYSYSHAFGSLKTGLNLVGKYILS